MNIIKKRLTSVFIIIALAAVVLIVGVLTLFNSNKDSSLFSNYRKETLHLWYTDDALTDFLNSKAVAFYEKNDIRVETKLVSGLEYLEKINQASLDGDMDTTPDVFIVTNDSLEKAYLAGLATKLDKDSLGINQGDYCQTAFDSVTYQGEYIGLPLYYETASLLYNRTYLEQISQEAGISDANGLIPVTIADILNFADRYSAPENVEYFFRWDVSDIFYNYFFIGNYITVGGDAGDDKDNINIYNNDAIISLKVYQQMNQFFSIDTKDSSYAKVMEDFLQGKTLYTIATSDCMTTIEEAKKNGEFNFEYGIASLPDINSDLKTKGMSVTNALVVNGYSSHKASAKKLISFISYEAGNDLYKFTGKLPARIGEAYENNNMFAFALNYEDSVSIPKMIETSNFWLELEGCFARVLNGNDANTQLQNLAEKIFTQLAGEPVKLNRLISPEVELLNATEYEPE